MNLGLSVFPKYLSSDVPASNLSISGTELTTQTSIVTYQLDSLNLCNLDIVRNRPLWTPYIEVKGITSDSIQRPFLFSSSHR